MLNQHKLLRVFRLITLLKKAPSKSIRIIASLLEITKRTAYRYINLLNEIGLNVKKDKNNKFYIESNNKIIDVFTNEEAALIKELLLINGQNNMLKDSIF